MNKAILGAAFLALAGTSGAVQAADLPYRPAQPYTVNQPLNAFSWAGPYIGANLGYGWGSVDNNPTKPSGMLGGAQAGYNWQTGQFVYGIEGDIQVDGASDTFAQWKFSNPWFGTARGRIGYGFNNVLVYGTGGLAFGDVKAQSLGQTETHSSIGWTLGVGAEVGLSQNWSAKVEYLYVDLSDQNYTITRAPNNFQFGMLRFGVNYHF